ncbi:tripartite tricarboxylate transporter permease [Labrenzia sp. PHM005]|uniref:tripartite tricarboxylate transporter permease n=1 Tax=Labrenzia sp. PHM005 TaxID=2590016 RepID=UPI0011401990|nr:tripartite tricarboxylate transporter permease [Labrenzia sp. PHM005]QDG76283.1 Tat pathway signal protein [Labrenzia sp. PHM005]
MGLFENLATAAPELFTIKTMILMMVGTMAGLVAGAIPGFTIAMAVVLVLPFTFSMTPVEGLATMIAVYVGGLSGGLMSGILTGIPGTPSSVATTFDGYPMARGGKPGLALGIGVWASFFGGVIASIVLMIVAPQLALIGLEFQPVDYFSLILFALTVTASMAGDQILKGLMAALLGLLISTVGNDVVFGLPRFTFGVDPAAQGFAFLPVLVGLFAFSRLLGDVRTSEKAHQRLGGNEAHAVHIDYLGSAREVIRRWGNIVRSSLIGVFVGVLPAAGSTISNILAYDQAKKTSKDSDKFGSGAIDGIIAPESANNATAGGALIVMMALGLPGDIMTAIMLGALLIHDVIPSPSFITDEPQIAYSIFLAFFVANFMMLFMQSFTLRAFVLVTKVKMYMLTAVILFYCSVGIFALNNITYDMWTLFIFGIIGFVIRALGFPIVPMVLGVVLGGIAEARLSQVFARSDDIMVFISRPWSLFFLLLGCFSLLFPYYQKHMKTAVWARFFVPALLIVQSIPVFMMPGIVRPSVAIVMALTGAVMVAYRLKNGGKAPEAEQINQTS